MDIVDVASANEERHRHEALKRARERRFTGQRIDERGQVRCQDCAQVIPPRRLAAAPFAARCIECESTHERGRA